MPRNPTNIGQKRTPLGGGKRSRKRQCRLAAQARWKSKSDVLLSENKDLTSHVLRADGDAERSDYTNLNGLDGVQEPAGEQDNQSTARRKLRVMRDCVREAAGSDTKQRCILELSSLNKILAAVPCSFCGGLLAAVFGDKMGFSREIKVVCEDCEFRVEQYSCARQDGSNKMTTGFDVNSSMVHCFNQLGCGEAALRKFSAFMAIPGLAHNTYRRLSKVGRAHTDSEVTANVLTAAVHDISDQGECAAVHDVDEENDSSTDSDSDCDGVRDGGDEDGDGGDHGGDGGNSQSFKYENVSKMGALWAMKQ